MDNPDLAEATRMLGGAVLGPRELAAALGFDPLGVLTPAERAAVARLPFGAADLERARAEGELLVLRGVGYLLRDEWTIDDQPFATAETCAAGWWLVRRLPLPATLGRTYREQERALAALGPADSARPRRRSAVEIAFDTLCWQRVHGERLLAAVWDWSRSPTPDGGYVALGEHGPEGLHVVAYSRAVKFGTLGVCAQR